MNSVAIPIILLHSTLYESEVTLNCMRVSGTINLFLLYQGQLQAHNIRISLPNTAICAAILRGQKLLHIPFVHITISVESRITSSRVLLCLHRKKKY